MKEANFEELVVQCTSQKVAVRVPAYRTITQKSTGELEKFVWSDFASLDDTHKTLVNIKADLFNETHDISYEAAGVCGCLLANDSFLSLVNSEDEANILDVLIKAIKETKEKKVLTRSLWSLAKSRLNKNIYLKRVHQIIETINGILTVEDASSITVHEAMQVFQSLLGIIPNEMGEEAKQWFPSVFIYMFHDVGRVRIAAFATLSKAIIVLEKMEDFDNIRLNIVKVIIPDLKAQHCKQMNRLVGEECIDILKEWKLIVKFLGKELHPGTSLINGLLEVVEKGFKSSKPEIRVDAFKCWQALIDNFSLDDSVLTHLKRLKLLLAPLKANNAKTEDIAYAKLLAWWHLICKLGKKASINFDLIVIPLLRFCFGCGSPSGGAAIGLSERNLIMSGATASPGRKFSGLHIACAEILAQILSVGIDIPGLQTYSFSTQQMDVPILTSPTLFVRYHQLLLNCISEAVQSLNSKEHKQYNLGVFLFQAVLAHIRVAINLDENKKDNVEIVKELFNTISSLERLCSPGDSQSQFVFKFLEMVTVGSLALPRTVLNSRHYHIATGNTMRDVMSGTLSNHLIHQLCKPSLLHYATSKEGFFSMWLAVLANSKPLSGKLGFLQSVMKELDCAAAVLCPANPNTLVQMWSTVVHQLIEHIQETQIIDQGDGGEHDWSCIYSILLFPINHSIDALSSADHLVYQQIMTDWIELWIKFTELTPLTPTADANSEVEHVARALINVCVGKLTAPPDIHAATYTLMAHVLAVITEKFTYSELGKTSVRSVNSPAKPRKKPHPLHNLAACVELYVILLQRVLRIVSNQRQRAAAKLCEAIVHVFKGVQQTKMVESLVEQVISPMCDSLKVNPAARFNAEIEKKFITTFKTFGALLEKYFGTKHSADQLNRIAPLFVVSLKSSNKHIKLEAHKLWRSSFASTSLCIPSNLFDILKECGLPPASLTDLHENMEDSLSLSPKENLPANQAGSLLKHDIVGERKLRESPRVNSPLSGRLNRSTPVSKNKSKPKTKLEDMKDEDFVKITSPKPKRRVLTEHQVERMTERRSDIPALYSELSQAVSQDILPSQFASQYSFEDSSVDMKKGSSFKKPDTNDSKCSELKEATGGNSSVNKPSIDDLSFKGKLSSNTQNQPESEIDEEANELEKNTEHKNDAAKPFSETVVDNGERTEQSEAKTKDTETSAGCGELESMNVIEMFENTEGNEINRLKIQSKKEINEMSNVVNGTASNPKLLNPSEECDEQDKSEDSDEDSECVIRTDIKTYSGKKKKDLRRYGSGDSDYTDEDLNEELRRTSLEFQKSLDSLSDDSNTALKSSEFHRRKAKAPTKKNINDVRKSLKGTILSKKVSSDTSKIDSPLPSKKQMQEQRINFREVAVSPSVILDRKIAKQVPEVKLKDGALLAKQLNSKYAVSDTDSEDEIPDSQVAEKTDLYVSVFNRESPISLRGKSISVIRDTNRNTNEVPRKFSRSKRKRNSSEEDELTVNLDKKKKIQDKTQQLPIEKQSSSDDSVLIIEDKGGEQEEDKQGLCQKKGKENQKQQKVIEEISVMAARKMPKSQTRLTRKNSFNSMDSQPSSDHAGSNLSPCTPTKVTRSGRKIVAPNKDMPEPMTPPSSKKRKLQESTEESCVDDPKVTETLASSLKITPKKSAQKKITDLFNKSDKKISEMEANDNSDGDTLPEMDDLNDSQYDDKDDYVPRKEESTSTDSEVDADDHTLEGNKSVLVMYENISSSVAQEPKHSSTKESPRKDTGSLGEKSNERDTPIKTLDEEGEGSSSDVDVDGDDGTDAEVKSGDTSTVCKSEEDIKCNKILGKSTRHSKIKENITSKSEIVNDIIPCVSNLSEVNDVMQIGESLEPEGDREPQTTSANDVLSPVKGKSEAVMHKNENNTLEDSSSSQDGESVHEQQNEIHGNSDKKLSNCGADKSVTAKNGQCRIEIIKANTNDQELSNKSKKLENLRSVEVTKGSETSRKSDNNVPSESSSKEICILNSPELNNRSSEAKINVSEEVAEGTLDQKNTREGMDDSNVTCIDYSENEKKELVKKNDRDSVKYNNNVSEKVDKNLESVSFKAAEKTLSAFSITTRQQEEEHSPEKPCMSRLNSAVSTPERQKKKGSFKYAGSRAAMLVACAKQNIRNREANEGDSPCKCGGDASRYRHSGSPNRRSAPCRVSPSTPPNRKRKFVDG
nr:telomere-associated protein RIF1-like isoform X2 [Procambarus clarkii]